jgi:hypothetical protein
MRDSSSINAPVHDSDVKKIEEMGNGTTTTTAIARFRIANTMDVSEYADEAKYAELVTKFQALMRDKSSKSCSLWLWSKR